MATSVLAAPRLLAAETDSHQGAVVGLEQLACAGQRCGDGADEVAAGCGAVADAYRRLAAALQRDGFALDDIALRADRHAFDADRARRGIHGYDARRALERRQRRRLERAVGRAIGRGPVAVGGVPDARTAIDGTVGVRAGGVAIPVVEHRADGRHKVDLAREELQRQTARANPGGHRPEAQRGAGQRLAVVEQAVDTCAQPAHIRHVECGVGQRQLTADIEQRGSRPRGAPCHIDLGVRQSQIAADRQRLALRALQDAARHPDISTDRAGTG
ncbi:hypothetical protein G6F57_014411 [Rhizopus arrhizus]|nr:hypothetical protein G6F57_014411 [Rhizopus arrhizus]